MVGGDVTPTKKLSYTEIFESECPFFMAIGMTYHEFWFEDSYLVRYYREAHNYKRKIRNEEMWVEGMYIAKAVGCALSDKNKYPEKPIDIFPKTAREKQAEIEANRQKAIDFFTNLKNKWSEKNGNNRQLNS